MAFLVGKNSKKYVNYPLTSRPGADILNVTGNKSTNQHKETTL